MSYPIETPDKCHSPQESGDYSKENESIYYSGRELLSKKDLDGDTPSIFISAGTRSAGKTFYFLQKCLEDFRNGLGKFILVYRHRYETSGAEEIFNDVLSINPHLGKAVTTKSIADGLIRELKIDEESFGYAVCLQNTDEIKKYSPVFGEVTQGIFDEFILENGRYLTNEIKKFHSLALSIARGRGKQSRYIAWYFLGNKVTLMNPWFIYLGIYKRIKKDTHFMRGKGWVLEFVDNESAKKAIDNNPLSKIFDSTYAKGDEWLLDANTFIETPEGKNRYIMTINSDGRGYGVREYYNEGIIYISEKPDPSCKFLITIKNGDHNQNTIMLKKSSILFSYIRESYNNASLRFDSIRTKEMVMDLLAIDLYK